MKIFAFIIVALLGIQFESKAEELPFFFDIESGEFGINSNYSPNIEDYPADLCSCHSLPELTFIENHPSTSQCDPVSEDCITVPATFQGNEGHYFVGIENNKCIFDFVRATEYDVNGWASYYVNIGIASSAGKIRTEAGHIAYHIFYNPPGRIEKGFCYNPNPQPSKCPNIIINGLPGQRIRIRGSCS